MDEAPPAASEDGLLIAYLRDRDVDCPSCGYNLRDLTASRCPECGEALALRLTMVEPKQKALIFGLVGLSAGLGFNLLLFIYWLAMTIVRSRSNGTRDVALVTLLVVGSVLFGALIAAWLRCWPRIRRLPSHNRALLAGLAWGIVAVDLALFISIAA